MKRALHITQARRSVPNGPLTVARLGLRTKCYGADNQLRGPVPKGESDV